MQDAHIFETLKMLFWDFEMLPKMLPKKNLTNAGKSACRILANNPDKYAFFPRAAFKVAKRPIIWLVNYTKKIGFCRTSCATFFKSPKKMELHKEDWVFQPFSNPKISQRNPKTLPEAQRTQGIESITWIIFLTEINFI